MTEEQLEAARAERMRQNGHGAITIEDVRTWIEETGLCTFLPRSAQSVQSAHSILTAPTANPTFVEAVAGQRTPEPTSELIALAESLLVRLEAEGVAVRLNLGGQPLNHSGDQPDYVVAGWVLPYIYALRGDRDWRRSPQLTGSRQVSQLAVQAARHLDSANLTTTQIRDALGREVTEAAVLRALHELWKQLRIIPVVPEAGSPALWQPLRQRFQKAIAEGASTSQVTAISVLASIYLQAVIAASMEDIEMFLSPLTSRSKIREVVRGLAATRQVHSTTMGHSPMFYVAGTLPEFAPPPTFQVSPTIPAYRGSSYLASYLVRSQDRDHDIEHAGARNHEWHDSSHQSTGSAFVDAVGQGVASVVAQKHSAEPLGLPSQALSAAELRPQPGTSGHAQKSPPSGRLQSSGKAVSPRPRAGSDRRRAPAPRSAASNANSPRVGSGSSRPARSGSFGNGNRAAKPVPAAPMNHAHNGNGSNASNGSNGSVGPKRTDATSPARGSRPAAKSWSAHPAGNGSGKGNGNGANGSAGVRPSSHLSGRTESRSSSRNGDATGTGAKSREAASYQSGSSSGVRGANGKGVRGESGGTGATSRNSRPNSHPGSSKRISAEGASRTPAANAAKRYSFSGQAKQAPKSSTKLVSGRVAGRVSKPVAPSSSKSRSKSARPADSKRRG